MKKVLLSMSFVVLLLVVGFLSFLLLTEPRAKVFEKRGVTVTLESDFKVYESENWNFYVENDEIAFMSNRFGKLSEFTYGEGEDQKKVSLKDFSLDTFMNLVLTLYGIDTPENPVTKYTIDAYDNYFYYCYYFDGNEKYAYMFLTAETDNFFYVVNIACDADAFNDSRVKMLQYAVSIEFE